MNQYETTAIETLRPYLSECMVLLRSNGDFPIEKPSKIGAYGSGVRNTLKGGTGSGEVNSRYYVTVEEALKNEGIKIENTEWLDAYDKLRAKADKEFLKQIKEKAKRMKVSPLVIGMGAIMNEPENDLKVAAHDVAIYVVSRISGEGSDRTFEKGDYLLNDSEVRDILYLHRNCKKFMLVLNVGGPVDLSPVTEVENVLVLSQLGVETGTALVDVLLGKANPSGKLTTSWTCAKDMPIVGTFGDNDDTNYNEGIYVGYRYYDTANVRPLYPFGYGRSYTDFDIKYENTEVTGECVKVKAVVRNSGKYPGKETLQLYVSCPKGKLDKAYQDLAAFVKTKQLQPEESFEVELKFPLSQLASYDSEKEAYVLEKGDYVLRLGNSSVDTKAVSVVELDEDVCVRKVKNVLGNPRFTDLVLNRETDDDLQGLGRLKVSSKGIPCVTCVYDRKEEVDERIKALSDEELVYLNIGAFSERKRLGSVIGQAAGSVAGAAGESSNKAKLEGLRGLIMADGPAGVRISKEYFEDEKGVHAYGPSLPATVLRFMPLPMRLLFGRKPKLKKGTELKYQYCTAIPISTAIAQSFNEEFARICGDIVGKEMEIFHIDLWLAPALNIHRSVLCGRNFEYFSEDPLLSGKMAAAITKGVQAHKGKGVTIKHYAANNQETNRYINNSNVSERAMREIYLKGFDICIEEARPHALMTSYNLLNGVHTNEHRGLCTDILRDEFGYDGLIMTDWEVSSMPLPPGKYPIAHPEKAALAGNDLYMPGSKDDFKRIMDALRSGELKRETLEEAVDILYRKVRELSE